MNASAAIACGRPTLPNSCNDTEVELDVVLDETVMSLHDVMSLQVGSRIMLNAGPGGAVQLRCGNVPLFGGKVGRRKRSGCRPGIEDTLNRPTPTEPREEP